MADVKRVGSLEVEQDARFQRYQWTVQRWAWLVMLLVIVAAVLGLLGSGPLSRTSAATPDGSLRVEYDRFLRLHAPATLTVTLGPGAAPDGTARLWLDRQYLHGIQIKNVTPRPEREEAGPDRHVLVFRVAAPGEPTEVVLHFEPEQVGRLPGRIGLGDGPAAACGQFVYP